MEALKVLNNRYQLLAVIKKGGFGIIYKGYDSLLGKDVAVKEIKPELLQNAWFVEQFQKEARYVAKMNHHNIVHIFDLVQTEDGRFYIIMEYIDGLDLSRLLQACHRRGRSLPPHLAVHIIAEVCKALDYAHNCTVSDSHEPANLVHEDVSPGNIMISKTGVVKLIDFGIAGLQNRLQQDGNTIPLQGKVPYMSPEHVGADRLDRRSDLFSLGLVLYEVLEGRRFFDREPVEEIVSTLRNGKLRLKEVQRTPGPLRNVLHKALQRDPEQRYQNANQFYIDLVTYLVLNTDTGAIDQEMARFIADLAGEPTAEPSFPLPESDALFEDVMRDIQGPKAGFGLTPGAGEAIKTEPLAHTPEPRTETHRPWRPDPAALEANPHSLTAELYTEVGEEVKTGLDANRQSSRGHKKLVLRSLTGLASAAALFLLADILFQWTALGTGIYDTLFPPTIRIASVPAGAKVLLNGEPLPGETPMRLEDIKPGNYELKLVAKGFSPIVKSLHVPSNGQARVQGEAQRRPSQPYLFRFKTTLEIASYPPEAQVFINGIEFGQNTPCAVTWEVGEPFQLELRKPGLAALTGFALDTEQMLETVEDRRLWEFDLERKPVVRARILGRFGKFFRIESDPRDAKVYLDGQLLGRTGMLERVFLSATRHTLRFEKPGYHSKKIEVEVREATPTALHVNLARPVKFVAYDATDGQTRDLGATVSRIVRYGKTVVRGKRTPTTIDLLPFEYEAYFNKEGFKPTRVTVSPTDAVVTARMQPVAAPFSVVITDADSGDPLPNVEVRCKSLDAPNEPEILLDVTDSDGTCDGRLKPGLYLFRTAKNGYTYQERTVMIQSQGLNLVEFNLVKR